jgi:hypothetical protein
MLQKRWAEMVAKHAEQQQARAGQANAGTTGEREGGRG